MSLRSTGLIALAAALIAAPAFAGSENASTSLSCPGEKNGELLANLDDKLSALDDKLSALDDVIRAQQDLRREALDRAKDAAREAVRQDGLSREQIDRMVSHAIHQAEVQATASAAAADAARRAMDQIKDQMKALETQMKALHLEELDDDSAHG